MNSAMISSENHSRAIKPEKYHTSVYLDSLALGDINEPPPGLDSNGGQIAATNSLLRLATGEPVFHVPCD